MEPENKIERLLPKCFSPLVQLLSSHFQGSIPNFLLLRIVAVLACFILGCFCPLRAQIITTIAGNGISGYFGDGGLATAAELYRPGGVTFDGSGNMYISDDSNFCIRKMDPAGIVTTVAGNGTAGFSGDGGPATHAQLYFPGGVAFDGAGNMYIIDGVNRRVRKVDAAGIITTFAGGGTGPVVGVPATAAHLGLISDILVDGLGNVYFTDDNFQGIHKVDPAGLISTFAGTGTAGFSGDGGPATAAQFSNPQGIAKDGTGNIYVGDDVNQRIRKIDTAGIVTTFAGSGPTGAAAGGFSGDGGLATAAQLRRPSGIAFDAMGNLYIADVDNIRIRKVDAAGTITTLAGDGMTGYAGDGFAATTAEFNLLSDVTADCTGNVYVCDRNNNRVRKITYDHTPMFTGGSSQNLALCTGATAVPINTILTAMDADTGQTETWSIFSAPAHGSVVASYTATSTGSALTPSGLFYTPTVAYTGTDSFKIRVSDCNQSSTTIIHVTIYPLPDAGTISGIDSVCPRHSISLSDTVSGGTWGSTNVSIASVSGSGIVTGALSGTDTITYTVSNPGCSKKAIFPVGVRSSSVCLSGVPVSPGFSKTELLVYPNPNEGTFTVNLFSSANPEVVFVLTNMVGEKIKEFRGTGNKDFNINLTVPAGVYFVSANTKDGRYNTKLIIKH